MIKRYTIKSTKWQAITTAGQSGSCWIEKNIRGNGIIYISHSDSGTPSKSYGFRLYSKDSNSNICDFAADNINDIYYARTINSGSKINILVDAI